MGNVLTRSHGSTKKSNSEKSSDSSNRTSLSRSTSGIDNSEQSTVIKFVPVEKLTKILGELTRHESENNHGVSMVIFTKYLFPNNQQFGQYFYKYLLKSSGTSSIYLSTSSFKHQIEKFLSPMSDRQILDIFVKIYSKKSAENGDDVSLDGFKDLFMISYRLAMDNNSSTCPFIDVTIESVVLSCFHGKESHSASFVSNWLWQHCPRIFYSVHRYVVHVLTTSYRNGKALLSTEELQPHIGSTIPDVEKTDVLKDISLDNLLPNSHIWLLSTTVALQYVQAEIVAPTNEGNLNSLMSGKLAGSICPTSWTLLYTSDKHGAAVNRLLHHVLGYRGPTILFIRGDCENGTCVTYCIGSTCEWRESTNYWGDDNSIIVQLQPTYRLIEKGPKLLYLNPAVRGFPQGFRAGKDPRKPFVNVDQSFNSVTIDGAPYRINNIVVWGCGDKKMRDRQLEIKQWEATDVQRNRTINLPRTEWGDNPDRYLLELAGRPTYSNGEKK